MKVLLNSFHLNGDRHTRVSSTDLKVRTTLYSIINSTKWKNCSWFLRNKCWGECSYIDTQLNQTACSWTVLLVSSVSTCCTPVFTEYMFTPQINCRWSHDKAIADWPFVRSFSRKTKREGLNSAAGINDAVTWSILREGNLLIKTFVSCIRKFFARSQASLRPYNGINCVAFSPC